MPETPLNLSFPKVTIPLISRGHALDPLQSRWLPLLTFYSRLIGSRAKIAHAVAVFRGKEGIIPKKQLGVFKDGASRCYFAHWVTFRTPAEMPWLFWSVNRMHFIFIWWEDSISRLWSLSTPQRTVGRKNNPPPRTHTRTHKTAHPKFRQLQLFHKRVFWKIFSFLLSLAFNPSINYFFSISETNGASEKPTSLHHDLH